MELVYKEIVCVGTSTGKPGEEIIFYIGRFAADS
jgi:hypothetical protein